jgi:hypothetical protein
MPTAAEAREEYLRRERERRSGGIPTGSATPRSPTNEPSVGLTAPKDVSGTGGWLKGITDDLITSSYNTLEDTMNEIADTIDPNRNKSKLPTTYEDLFPQIKDLLMQPGYAQKLLGGMVLGGYGSQPTNTENQFNGSQDFFGQPTQTGDYWGQMQDFFTQLNNDPTNSQGFMNRMQGMEGMTGADNPAMQFFNQFMQNRPDVSKEPGYGTYYDTAIDRALEDQQRASAARGSYGSTAAQDMEGRRIGELRAEQANREAEYNLKALAEQRAWEQLGGNLSVNASEAGRGWANTLGTLNTAADSANRALGLENLNKAVSGANVASSADAADLARTLGGIQSANLADTSKNNIMNTLTNLTTGIDSQRATDLGTVLSGGATSQNMGKERLEAPIIAGGNAANMITNLTGPQFQNLFGSDSDLMNTLMSLSGGTSMENMTQGTAANQNYMQAVQALINLLTQGGGNFGSMGGMGGGGGMG